MKLSTREEVGEADDVGVGGEAKTCFRFYMQYIGTARSSWDSLVSWSCESLDRLRL